MITPPCIIHSWGPLLEPTSTSMAGGSYFSLDAYMYLQLPISVSGVHAHLGFEFVLNSSLPYVHAESDFVYNCLRSEDPLRHSED
ncbi:unnamed protein product [Schistocephalus solidus]|uniref:Uncharacterized protein n=1 Tax=Schistocephalus solidus TaxID=70667 RepID=A0A183TIB3_SCHSO|nr:unnamed protein product [Schistocephalus solidus]